MLSITVMFDKGYDRAVQHLLSLMNGTKTENERCYFVMFRISPTGLAGTLAPSPDLSRNHRMLHPSDYMCIARRD